MWLLVIPRSRTGDSETGVTVLEALLPELMSPAVLAVAVFVTLGAAPAPTATVKVIAGSVALPASGPACVQLTVPAM